MLMKTTAICIGTRAECTRPTSVSQQGCPIRKLQYVKNLSAFKVKPCHRCKNQSFDSYIRPISS